MHWDKPPPSALARPKPYQGVRVRDPVKELLRRKRSLEVQGSKTAPPAVDALTQNSQPSLFPGPAGAGAGAGTGAGEAAQQCSGWRAPPISSSLQLGATPWSPADYSQQQDGSAQAAAYSATPPLAADVYMQTLCPSYTMLTYTHTPLLTNFGTVSVAPAPSPLPPMELPDSGFAYLPWAPPLATISTVPNPGVQFAGGAAALPGSPLVHMPLSMSVSTAAPQPFPPPADPDLRQSPGPQLDCELPEQPLDEDTDSESPSLLDKLLEERKAEEEEKDSYGGSLFLPDT